MSKVVFSWRACDDLELAVLMLLAHRFQSSCHPFQDLHLALFSRSFSNKLADALSNQ